MIQFDNTIPPAALKSAALTFQSEYYPTKYVGKVPLKIRMLKTVTSDLPIVIPGAADYIAIRGNEYYCYVNSHGAVTAILPDGKELGVKSDEFQVIEFHNQIK